MNTSNKLRLAIITTHPIQYYAPLFQLLHQRGNIAIKVFYTLGETSAANYDRGFNKAISWDIPLTEGYPYEWVKNMSTQPGSHHFKGIVNRGIIAQIEGWSPDAILVYGWAYSGHLKAMRYFKNKLAVYFRGDSTLLDEPTGVKGLLKSMFLKWVYKHTDHAFYVGQQNKNYFKRYGLTEEQLTFAPHAIDNSRFAKNKKVEADILRNNLKIVQNEILILFAGKFEIKKDPLLLLSAFKKLDCNCHLLFVGNGELETLLKKESLGNKRIHFLNFQNQSHMPVIYQACDLFCLPSRGPGETWGLAINEAMACGKAILTSNKVGCAIDLVNHGYNGFVFKSGDQTDLMYHLNTLTFSKEILQLYGNNSAGIIQNWNFNSIAEAIENKLLS